MEHSGSTPTAVVVGCEPTSLHGKGNCHIFFVANRALGYIILAIHAIICADGIKINCARTVPNNLAKTI